MKRIKIISFFLSILILSNCGIIIITPPAQWEKVDDFKVSPNTRPSELIKKYLGKNLVNDRNNYCITFFDIYCTPCYTQINYCNQLYEETKENFDWFSVTIYDSVAESKFRKKLEYPDDYLRYNFPTFYNINGLKSSLRNLYYNNMITKSDYVPMTIIIANDTIKFINDGAINSQEKYIAHKSFLDSLSQIYK